MNKKQEELLKKEFFVTNNHSITRGDFEGFPCPMAAFNWTDEQMQKLADRIVLDYAYDASLSEDENEDEWFRIIEHCAIELGMKYYEDLSDEEYYILTNEWNNIK